MLILGSAAHDDDYISGPPGGGSLSSKLRKLKQQAYEAGRKRDWSGAAESYAQILEMDKNNPSLLNEYGDVCMKAGETTKAVRQFLAAAAKYKQTGLLNNAQAVYKKVLRHDPKNLNANWFLAEIRSSQGLLADGVAHALTFLASAEEVSGEIKEIFLKRCLELFDLYPESDEVLERVEGIFRIWDMPLESARSGCLRACLAFQAGEAEEAQAAVDRLTEQVPELANYVEFTKWQQVSGKTEAPAGFSDVNSIDLQSDETPSPDPEPEVVADVAPDPVEEAPVEESAAPDEAEPEAESPADAAAAFEDFLDSGAELETTVDGFNLGSVDDKPAAAEVEKDDDGCISIDVGDGETSFADLVEGAAADVESAAEAANVDDTPAAPAARTGSVNLLDEILAEEGDDLLRSSDSEQVSTIASEIGRNLGSQMDADPETQYQQGLVFLEMGLYDQAALAFSAAAGEPTLALQSREMWGIALHREGRLDDALTVLQEGLVDGDVGGRSALGLHYQAGRILEELERGDEAQQHYRKVHAVDAGFADVAERLRTPVG